MKKFFSALILTVVVIGVATSASADGGIGWASAHFKPFDGGIGW
ncbi:hypothetical protein [Brevibacillus laterosporus]